MQFTALLIVWSKKVNMIVKWLKKRFIKELLMTKEGNQGFKSSTKYLIYENGYIDNKVKVRAHFHITGKYRGSAHRHCNINLI